MKIVLRVKNAEKRYAGTRALRGANLTLHRGEWLALLGPNGAGKTTLVRSIAGRVRLDAGSITLLDCPLNQGTQAVQAREKLGIVPQDIALYPLLTARENLECFGGLVGLKGSRLAHQVDWALEWTALADRSRALTRTFSGGMKRRLNIAASVLHRPEVVLLDEPTVGVDPQSRHRIWEMLDQLRREGASLLLTTHQLEEAQQICDRIVIFDHGQDIARGTYEELLESTISSRRHLLASFEAAIPASVSHLGTAVSTRILRIPLDDVVRDLSSTLILLEQAGVAITDLQLHSPTLQDVFIHLTGRELRE